MMTIENFCEALGSEITRLREARGLSQDELGAKVGIHRTSLSRYERGADMPLMLFVRLAMALDTHARDILDVVLDDGGNLGGLRDDRSCG